MLLLGFLRSSANFLAVGSIPSFSGARKRKRTLEDDDEAEDGKEADEEGHLEEEGHLDGELAPSESSGKRGTILITLRNVAPYTQW